MALYLLLLFPGTTLTHKHNRFFFKPKTRSFCKNQKQQRNNVNI